MDRRHRRIKARYKIGTLSKSSLRPSLQLAPLRPRDARGRALAAQRAVELVEARRQLGREVKVVAPPRVAPPLQRARALKRRRDPWRSDHFDLASELAARLDELDGPLRRQRAAASVPWAERSQL